MGERIALKAWYYDSVYRYTMTDNLQPIPLTSAEVAPARRRSQVRRRRYYILTHSSHLVDTARFLGGPIAAVRARLLERFGAFCWFISRRLSRTARSATSTSRSRFAAISRRDSRSSASTAA